MIDPGSILAGKTLCFYFTSNACKPCKSFAPKLEEVWLKAKEAKKNFEVVLVSQDPTKEEFDAYMNHCKFSAIPFEESDLRKDLRARWFVKGWPWVVITDDTGKILNPKGNDQILGGLENFPFAPPLVQDFTKVAPMSLNKQVCFFAFAQDAKSCAAVKKEMETLAARNKDMVFATHDESYAHPRDAKKMATKMRKFAKVKDGEAALVIVDVVGRVKHVRYGLESGNATKFLLDYSSGGLVEQVGTGQIPAQADVDDGKAYDYDLFVIGGGSGGLACSKAAAATGKKVAVADFVRPSPPGTTWGLGGTCVNVGCIPKKLCHTAALHGEHLHDAVKYGWNVDVKSTTHDWKTMITNVQAHVKSLNEGYESQLKSKDVKYYNAFASLVDKHTVQLKHGWGKDAKIETKTARRFVIACGGRPKYPDGPGLKEYSISSDDIFSMEKPPGKTLVVGASYVALECAGFLTGLGYDTTVMVRSIFLRGFDQQMANMIGDYMGKTGTKFLKGFVPTKCEKMEDGKLKVFYEPKNGGKEETIVVDTLLLAIGRVPETKWLNIDKLGMKLDKGGKILTATNEQTSVPNIYAIGDVASDKLELTPVAIMAGKLLAERLYNRGQTLMNYANVATTVFTPIEYGAIGLAEEDAIKQYGADNIEVYHATYRPLEMFVADRMAEDCYLKLVCNKLRGEQVIGLHILGPNAGEVTQGFSVAMRRGATKADFDLTVGIHPTVAEEFTTLDITKSSGISAKKEGC
eukprot:CAMPEP_0167805518 /NCGR_PEP_ID=MMETSP0111_2-20121227/21226_1 /TAXON_ID=91324 /ORGANISM="Lotharella globosa, Strain CCCM811" /LENGTH=746 /DNA_ID=CAMNT_0007702687 /DNA_START=63 /DNA_END=2303 /DNA_ORIENTATION=-